MLVPKQSFDHNCSGLSCLICRIFGFPSVYRRFTSTEQTAHAQKRQGRKELYDLLSDSCAAAFLRIFETTVVLKEICCTQKCQG